MTRNAIVAGALVALAGTHASADVFSWASAISGDWSDHAMWNGPAFQTPDSILDSAILGGGNYEVVLDQNVSVGSLSISGDASVLGDNHSLFVNGDVSIMGSGSSLSVGDTPALRDFDADDVTVGEGFLVVYGGVAQIDGELRLTTIGGTFGGALVGGGDIEMNGSDDLVIERGVLWAMGGPSQYDTLTVRRTGSSTAKLDWTSPTANVTVWDAKTLSVEIPYAGALGGEITVSGSGGEARFVSDDPFVAGASSELVLVGGTNAERSIIEAPGVDSYGHIFVDGYGQMDSPLLAMRGTGQITPGSTLRVSSSAVFLDSFAFVANGPGASFVSSTPGQTVNVVGGSTAINLGDDGVFDLDGAGDRVVNIAAGSELSITAEHMDTANEVFNGTLNIEGDLLVNAVQGAGYWVNAGEINLENGGVYGRGFTNEAMIVGDGDIVCDLDNRGEIVADAGTLSLHDIDLDGQGSPQAGVVRAQTGDIVLPNGDNFAQHFSGDLYVGDGVGVREVFEMQADFWLQADDGKTGTITMNSGRMRASRIHIGGEFSSEGSSRLTVPSGDGVDRISFVTPSVNTISGTLEVDGETWTTSGATFLGDGEIYADSSLKSTYLQDDSDLAGVSLRSRGSVYLVETFGNGRASMANLTLEPTATLVATIEAFNAPGGSDRYLVGGQATLDGTLKLDLRVGLEDPTPGETYTIIEAGSVVGTFDEVDLSEVSDQFRAEVGYHADRVDVFVTCKADINGDGVVNGTDYGAWLNAFNHNMPVADQNGDGVVDPTDFGAWLANFNSGCGTD